MNLTKYICHRKPERSFFFRGHQFPVCARCTGFYISGISTMIFLKLTEIDYNYLTLVIGILLLIPCAIDGGVQLFQDYESNNTKRLITGLTGGIGAILVYASLFYLMFGITY